MIVGTICTKSLIVRSSMLKFTKGGKQYLQMELFDGTTSIQAMDWDYTGKAAPAKNMILDIKAEVSEFNGNKQLKILSAKPNLELTPAAFAPQGDMDIEDYISKAWQLIADVGCKPAAKLCGDIFNDFHALWTEVPGARSIHHAYVAGTLRHSVDTAIKALALARTTEGVNKDLCVVGGLLHDFGKLWTYKLDGAVIDYTVEGNLLDHIPLGMIKIEKYRTEENYNIVSMVQHIMASHHGMLEWGSPVTPGFIEAWFVHLADMADARATTIKELCAKAPEGSIYTDKSYALGNKYALTQKYVNEVMK